MMKPNPFAAQEREAKLTKLGDALQVMDASRDIYADKGYVNQEREERLTNEGWRMHIQHTGSKDKPLSKAQERRNRRIASPRARVEHVFAGMAQLGGKVLRSIGLARAALHLHCKAATYNLRRLCYLREAKILAFSGPKSVWPTENGEPGREMSHHEARLVPL